MAFGEGDPTTTSVDLFSPWDFMEVSSSGSSENSFQWYIRRPWVCSATNSIRNTRNVLRYATDDLDFFCAFWMKFEIINVYLQISPHINEDLPSKNPFGMSMKCVSSVIRKVFKNYLKAIFIFSDR